MTDWRRVEPIVVGGLVAVGFLDEGRVVVGSHSGLGVFDAGTGALLNRVEDPRGDYAWFQESPPVALLTDSDIRQSVPVAGLWGGKLPTTTRDGWSCRVGTDGAELLGPDGAVISMKDDEEPRACGFSTEGQAFAFATSSTVHLAVRASN